jgi:hypothetical protein
VEAASELRFDLFPGDDVGLRFSAPAISAVQKLVGRSRLNTHTLLDVAREMFEVRFPPQCLGARADTLPGVPSVGWTPL